LHARRSTHLLRVSERGGDEQQSQDENEFDFHFQRGREAGVGRGVPPLSVKAIALNAAVEDVQVQFGADPLVVFIEPATPLPSSKSTGFV
jgi:hypothetical protein